TRHSTAHGRQQVVVVEGLREEVEDSCLHGPHRCGDVTVRCQEHGRGVNSSSDQLLVELQARHPRESEIHDQASWWLLPRPSEKALCGFERADLETILP